MKTNKLHFPDLIQPKDRNDPLYRLLEEYIIDGDNKSIATRLDVNESMVSDVKRGIKRSRRIWDGLVCVMMRRKKERDRVLAYMQTPLAVNKAA
jgi:hypothetical protein